MRIATKKKWQKELVWFSYVVLLLEILYVILYTFLFAKRWKSYSKYFANVFLNFFPVLSLLLVCFPGFLLVGWSSLSHFLAALTRFWWTGSLCNSQKFSSKKEAWITYGKCSMFISISLRKQPNFQTRIQWP